jgi:hypothetical protein
VDFIERYLGFSPNHGDGSLEAILLIALVTIVTGIALGFFRKHHVRNVRYCPKRTSLVALHMSAFGGKADMIFCGANV